MAIEVLKKEKNQAIFLAFFLVFLAGNMQYWTLQSMRSKANNSLESLSKADTIQYLDLESKLKISSPELATLKSQYQTTQYIKTYYKVLAVEFYANFYSFTICSILFKTFLVIAIFLVMNKGWTATSILLKTFLLSTVVISSIYYFLPNVLCNKENIFQNSEKVKVFQDIQANILSTVSNYNNIDSLRIDSAISRNYLDISKNLDYNTTIDNSSLNSNPQDMLKSLGN